MTQQIHLQTSGSTALNLPSFEWLYFQGFHEKLATHTFFRLKGEAIQSRETQLLLLVRDDRDQSAFRELYKFYSPKLNGFLMKRGLSGDAAADILQDVFISIWKKASQFDAERAPASAWIYRIARNKMIDHIRKEPMPIPEEFQILTEHPERDASEAIELHEDVDALNVAMKTLKPEQRSILERAYLGEMSHSEIQSITGLPLGTIKSRIRLGLEKLRHTMKATDK